MGQDRELNQVSIIQNALIGNVGFTSGEKKYFSTKVSEWVSEDKSLNLLISKFSESSLDIRPLLKQNGLLV